MTTKFREPPIALLGWIRLSRNRELLCISDEYGDDATRLDVSDAEELLEVLLDICPNAKALAHNWLLEEQKREHMKGKP